MGFQQGLSGLNAAAKNLDVIGNNVANANTAGFKKGVATFGDVFVGSLGGGGGIGTQLTGVNQQFSQGGITVSNNPLDVAINGSGFFRMSNGGEISYSRNGGFLQDRNGFIVNGSGQNLTGFPAVNGVIVSGVLSNLQLPTTDLLPRATANTSVGANLASDAAIILSTFNPADPGTYNFSTTSSSYDSLGQAHTVSLYFNKTAPNVWRVNTYIDGVVANGAGGPTTLTFNSQGGLSTATNLVKSLALTNGAAPLLITLNMNQMTQFGSSFGVNALAQDGYASGQLAGYNIDSAGIILGRYTNGQTQALGQIGLANFANVQGLQPMGDNLWAASASSGVPLMGVPGTASLGLLQSAATEDSNVDLTAELVNMIIAQRIYQANAQSIKTQDALMQTMLNMQ